MDDPLQKILESSLHNVAAQRNYESYMLEIIPVSSDGANYTSKLYRGKISAPDKRELQFFGKIATIGEDFRSQMPTNLYLPEQLTYKKLSKVFEKLENQYNVSKEHRLRVPELFWCSDKNLEETLLIEDLEAQSFGTYNRFEPITWEYASKAVEEIAKFHALCISMENHYPEDYKEVISGVNLSELTDMQATFIDQLVKKGLELVKNENKERVTDFITQSFTKAMPLFIGSLRRPVLVHGDFRISNLMHKLHEDGSYEMVIIDYQTLHVGTVAKDLIYFIFTGSDAEFREKHYQKLLEHYYEQLSHALTRFNLDPDKVFPKEDYDYEMKECLILGLMFALISLPVTTVEAENAPDLNAGIESFSNMKTSDLCSQRLNEVVDDFIRWGVVP